MATRQAHSCQVEESRRHRPVPIRASMTAAIILRWWKQFHLLLPDFSLKLSPGIESNTDLLQWACLSVWISIATTRIWDNSRTTGVVRMVGPRSTLSKTQSVLHWETPKLFPYSYTSLEPQVLIRIYELTKRNSNSFVPCGKYMYGLRSYWKIQKLSPKPNLKIKEKHMYFPLHKSNWGT